MTRLLSLFLVSALLLAAAPGSRADVKMPAIFGSGMVLQRQLAVPVWGTADAGEKVTVGFAGQTAEATAGANGQWKVALKPMEASATPQTLTVKGKNEVKFDNVLVGDVWVCSGQSNMEMGVGACNIPNEIAKADFPQIRLFFVEKATATEAQHDLHKPTQWKACSPKTVAEGGVSAWAGFSATGYFFGRELHQKINIPIGLIGAYWGATPAQAWTSTEALAARPQLAEYYLKGWEAYTASYPAEKKKYDALLANLKKSGSKQPAPRPPQDPVQAANGPAHVYNAMVAPLIPYGIKGAIWYQGESNAGDDAMIYRSLFATMITDWRTRWGQGDFPFFFVQLANIMGRVAQPSDPSWAWLRESQLRTLRLKNTGMAVIIDIGDEKDVHPKDKLNVGKRLALAAEKVAYGMDVVYSGPVFEKMEVKDGKAVLSFKNVGSGLVSKTGQTLKSFAIAGADKKFVWGEAKIEGDTVVVSSTQVKDPAAVRYAWANNPEVSLFNKEGLPATPFRSDRWAPPAGIKPLARSQPRRPLLRAGQPVDEHGREGRRG